jgi:hypothetical protein
MVRIRRGRRFEKAYRAGGPTEGANMQSSLGMGRISSAQLAHDVSDAKIVVPPGNPDPQVDVV